MAKYKEMLYHKPNPEWIENDFVASGKVKDNFTLAIGPIRIELTKEEKENTVDTLMTT